MINLEEQLNGLYHAISIQDQAVIQEITRQINPADLATLSKNLEISQRVSLFESMPNAAYVLEYLSLTEQADIANHLPKQRLIKIISDMHSDSRVDLIKVLPLSLQQLIYNGLDTENVLKFNP